MYERERERASTLPSQWSCLEDLVALTNASMLMAKVICGQSLGFALPTVLVEY